MNYLTTIAGLTLSLLVAAPAAATEAYPSRPITWVVPFGAGGVTDSTARIMAKAMSQIIGQPVLVDNRPGAGGIVGTEYVAAAKPDGYTILYASTGPMAVNQGSGSSSEGKDRLRNGRVENPGGCSPITARRLTI